MSLLWIIVIIVLILVLIGGVGRRW